MEIKPPERGKTENSACQIFMAGGITVLLQFGHPQPVGIAVGVYSQGFVITEAYRGTGIIAGLSDFEMPAVFGLDINPFNVVLRNHGVIYTSQIDMNSTILNRDRRQMLFPYIPTLIVFRSRVRSAFLWTYPLTGIAPQSDCFANFNPTVLKMLMGENEERKSRNPVTLVFHPIIFDTFSFDSMFFSPYMQDLRLILYLHTQHECRRSIQFAPPESA